MSSKGKIIGTKAETAVVKAARRFGFGGSEEKNFMDAADRHVMKGSLDEGDVWLCPGVIVEVKGGEMARAASDNLIDSWLGETYVEKFNAHADVAFLVVQRRGVGEANAHRWWAVWQLGELLAVIGAKRDDRYALSQVRMTFETALTLLRANGWGDPL